MTQDLISLGKLAEILQRPPREIQRALDSLGVAPALRLNDIDHFDRDVTNRLRGYFLNVGKAAR